MECQVKEGELRINGVLFRPRPGVLYARDYPAYFKHLEAGGWSELFGEVPLAERPIHMIRQFCKEDLWFLIYFILGNKLAEHPFVVDVCREVNEGPRTNTLDLWAREHFKSTVITIGESIQDVLRNPEERVGIFSHTKPAAIRFLRAIKFVMETSDILKAAFPDILYQEPRKEAFKWAEEDGLFLRRKGNYKEPTFSAHGLIEGMPVGDHYSKRVYDDVETPDLTYTPEITQRLKDQYDMSQNLGTLDGRSRVVGTPYHHEGLLMYLRGKVKEDGTPVYVTRLKPATEDGEPNGRSVFLPEERLVELRTNRQMFYSQQLLDPTPLSRATLDPRMLHEVFTAEIPKKLIRFMVVDPAGVRKDRVGDAWAIWVVGVEPFRDDLGASDIWVLDGVVEVMTEAEALQSLVDMYMRNGRIVRLGVEKVGMSTMEIHVAAALRAKRVTVTLENGGLAILSPAGRSKAQRIEANLAWPLMNGKVHVSAGIPAAYRERLKLEMQKFPFWHDDGLDALSYVWDLLKDYRFGPRDFGKAPEKKKRDAWDDAFKGQGDTLRFPWMVV